jgi:RND family efflux transporter MFP subunit
MNTKQILAITALLACGLLQGCTKTAKMAAKPPTPVKVEAVQSYAAPGGARYSASIAPGAQVELAFSVGGYLDKVTQVKGADGRLRNLQQGDSVRRGLVLANVRTRDYAVKEDQASGQLAQARANLLTSKKQLAEAEVGAEKARLDYERAQALFAAQSLTKPDYDSAKMQYDLYRAKVDTARSQLAVVEAQIATAEAGRAAATITKEDTVLRAPLDGVILQRQVEVGELISPGAPGFVLADTSTVKAVFGVPDLQVQNLKLGSPLTVELEALPAKQFTGQITSVSPSADQKTRLFEVEVSIRNPEGLLKIGMISSLTLAAPSAEEIAIPLNAIVRPKDQPEQYALFVVEDLSGAPQARLRTVTLGEAYGNRVVVKSGVKLGDRVITSGGSRLVDGEAVQVVP